MTAASHLFSLLEACEAENIPAPRDTKHIAVDEETLRQLSVRLEVQPYLAEELFDGLPVKQVHALVKWTESLPVEDRIRALRAWKRKRSAVRSAA